MVFSFDLLIAPDPHKAVTHSGEVEVKQEAPLDLSGLSNEELDQFERL